MPKAWFCVPSARNEDSTVSEWKQRGYGVALFRDTGSASVEADIVVTGKYPGYALAVNVLSKIVLALDAECSFIVCGGDDTLPDPNSTPEQIAVQLCRHFGGTFGVCQPTADRFAGGSIDRICGSPWMGRSFCERMNKGQGPFHPGFTHMHGDECLQECAIKLGVLWQRPDLTHFHNHFMRDDETDLHSDAVKRETPPHLVKWNTPEHWAESKALFERLKADDFKECMP